MKYNVLIGGAAGLGIDTISILVEKILKRKGFFIYSNKDYMSRVRGGHNFIQVRFGTEPIYSHWPELDVIIALDKETVEFHAERLCAAGVIICDESLKIEYSRTVKAPLAQMAAEVKNPRALGSAAAGALLKIFGQNLELVKEVFIEKFERETAESNYHAFQLGYEYAPKYFEISAANKDSHILINGNAAIAMGALAGGVSFYASYPMTPATSIMTQLSMRQDDAGIVVEQVEDEISAINMTLGASYAGVRAMTGTSGGGFALMVEALSLQGAMELPLVVINSQRPGPSTGIATRTEQSDLDFVLTAGHGEFPRMVLAVRNSEDAFYQTARALNIADQYQVLVIILTDQYLADAAQTIEPFDFSRVSIDRYFAEAKDIQGERYKRYMPTESGVSPRIIPGKIAGAVVLSDSHEHNEYGHISESAEIRTAMMNKRMKKLELLAQEIQEPEYFGVEKPDVLLLGWGSMQGPMREAVELFMQEGKSVGALVFGDLYPLPTKLLKKYANTAKKLINIEQNFTGQLAKLIRQETGIFMNDSILNYNGRQLDSYTICSRLKKEVL
ncbi:MAG: pyruvate flavodoxin/ferredoxin oxidoreductase domain protein [Clostridia bacterium]|jgi:2-oxoglutarate ferredoxin oxidoreductase subunit alpha|nr:pyruvate flavodoxin/ferredoxin oxidoreductase domain protein [Clostridia bacterium]